MLGEAKYIMIITTSSRGWGSPSEKVDKGDYVRIQMHRRCEPDKIDIREVRFHRSKSCGAGSFLFVFQPVPVVTAEHHNSSPGDAEGEEDLTCRFPPHLASK